MFTRLSQVHLQSFTMAGWCGERVEVHNQFIGETIAHPLKFGQCGTIMKPNILLSSSCSLSSFAEHIYVLRSSKIHYINT